MSVITLTTDFGVEGRYVAQMKGVLYGRAPGVTVVDLSHDVPPQDVAAGARLLSDVAPWWPEGTVHLAVVDPGVGTDRPIVAIDALGQRFVGPDNGLFGWLVGRGERVVRLSRERLSPAGDSATFHGRDLMAPASALLATGADLPDLGETTEGLVSLEPPVQPVIGNGRIEGQVVEADHYGNLITNIAAESLGDAPRDDRLRVTIGQRSVAGIRRTYGESPPHTLIALVGSTGLVELAIVNGSAAQTLGTGRGESVVLEWGALE